MSRTKVDLMEVIPCRSEHITTTEGEHGEVTLSFPRFKRKWMQRLLLPKGMSPYIRVPLEAHGSAVWRLIDGQRPVKEIVKQLAPHFPADEPYAERVSRYMMQLRKDNFVRFLIPRDPL